jgi:hypothetical protein
MVRRRRSAAVMAVAVTVLGWCTACATSVPGHSAPGDDVIAQAPRFGTCWQLRTADFGTPLDQPAPRTCAQPHDTETVWVATNALDRDLDYPSRLQVDQASGALGKALDDVCDFVTVSTYLGDEAGLHAPYVTAQPRLPSRTQWAAGARWVRCDVVYGIDAPQPAPGRMSGGLDGPQTAALRACYAGTPADHGVVPCSAAHEAEIVPDGLYLAGRSPYPTEDRARQRAAQSVCAQALTIDLAGSPAPPDARLDLYLEPPDPDDPTAFSATCVLVRIDGTRSTTVELP